MQHKSVVESSHHTKQQLHDTIRLPKRFVGLARAQDRVFQKADSFVFLRGPGIWLLQSEKNRT